MIGGVTQGLERGGTNTGNRGRGRGCRREIRGRGGGGRGCDTAYAAVRHSLRMREYFFLVAVEESVGCNLLGYWCTGYIGRGIARRDATLWRAVCGGVWVGDDLGGRGTRCLREL